MEEKLISKVPEGPLAEKWTRHKAAIRVVSPANKRKLDIIVIILYKRLSPKGTLDCGTGRYKCRQELPE